MTRDIHLEKLYKLLVAGEKFGPAMRKVGVWSDSYCDTPIRLKESKKYNRFMDSKLQTIDAELEKIMASMRAHDITDEEYKVKVNAYAELTKVKLQVQTGATEITMNVARLMTDAEIEAEEERLKAQLNAEETGPADSAPAGETTEGEGEA